MRSRYRGNSLLQLQKNAIPEGSDWSDSDTEQKRGTNIISSQL
jgi:hypothetical protein